MTYCHKHGRHNCQACIDELVSLGIQADKDRIAELEAKVAELEPDAMRYRKLRQCIGNKDASLKAQSLFWNISSRKRFDAAVDGLEVGK